MYQIFWNSTLQAVTRIIATSLSASALIVACFCIVCASFSKTFWVCSAIWNLDFSASILSKLSITDGKETQTKGFTTKWKAAEEISLKNMSGYVLEAGTVGLVTRICTISIPGAHTLQSFCNAVTRCSSRVSNADHAYTGSKALRDAYWRQKRWKLMENMENVGEVNGIHANKKICSLHVIWSAVPLGLSSGDCRYIPVI